MNEPTSTVVATLASAIVSATTAIASPYPSNIATEPPYAHNTSDTSAFPSPSPPSSSTQFGPGMNPALMSPLLCDWIRTAADCRDADFIRVLLIVSSALHGFVFLFGFWLLIYRNRGLNSKIVSELFITVGTGVRPKPMDCIIFFTAIASLIKVGVNAPLILDVWKDKLWLRIAIEQTYWVFVAIGFSSYFVGLLYAMPVTTREGVFAVYQPETTFDARPLSPIHVLTPTTVQKNFILIMGALYPAIFGAGAGVASAVFAQMEGQENLARILLLVQYSNWVLILWSMAIMFFYYGLKYTFILRANIIIAEAALKAPKAAFGISNLRSASPARFLFIQLQITGFGGAAVTLLAGTLCLLWVVFRDQILTMEQDQLPHTMAFFWTCAIAAAYFVIMALIAVQSVRNRRRGLHDPSSSFTASVHKSSSGQGQSAVKSLYSSHIHQNHKNSNSSSSSEQHLYSVADSIEFQPREYYNHSSFDIPDKSSVEALVMAAQRIDYDAFAVSHQINKMEVEKTQKADLLTSPKKPLTIKAHSPQALAPSPSPSASTFATGRRGDRTSESGSTGHASILSTGSSTIRPQHQDLRHTVFGSSRSIPRPNSPPPTPSPSTSSFPLTSLRSAPRPNPSAADDQDARLSYLPYMPPTTTPPSAPMIPERKKSRLHSDHHNDGSSHPLADRLPRPERSSERQPPAPPNHPSSSLQYHVSCKGLSPPPRAKRLPIQNNLNYSSNSPENSLETDDSLLPSPQFPTTEPGRNTFMAAPKDVHYSATPRIGGGTRRKSIKESDERAEREPAWPLPPASS